MKEVGDSLSQGSQRISSDILEWCFSLILYSRLFIILYKALETWNIYMLWAHTNLCKYCVNSSYQTCSGRSPESSRTVPPLKRPHTDSVCPLWLWCAWIHQQPRFCEETSGSRQTLFQAAGFPSWHVWFLYEGVCFPEWGNLEFIEKLLVLQFAMENIEKLS